MRIFNLLSSAVAALIITGCTCTPHKEMQSMVDSTAPVGTGRQGDNVSLQSGEGPLKDVHYSFDSYALDAAAKQTIKSNAEYIKANNVEKIQVEGHCDERGTNEYNMVLGANRARAAMEYLRSLGVSGSKMSTVSYGEELPLDPSHNEQAWAETEELILRLSNS